MVTREMIDDLRGHCSIDAVQLLEDMLITELEMEAHKCKLRTREYKRVISSIDPYGEENWED